MTKPIRVTLPHEELLIPIKNRNRLLINTLRNEVELFLRRGNRITIRYGHTPHMDLKTRVVQVPSCLYHDLREISMDTGLSISQLTFLLLNNRRNHIIGIGATVEEMNTHYKNKQIKGWF